MADIKFSELQKATTSKDSDEIAILQDGVNKMIASPILESKIINKTVTRVIEQGGASLNLINLKGVVPTYADLATITPTPELNDAYQVEADGLVYVYTENGFQADGDGFQVQPEPTGVVEEGNTEAVSGGEVYVSVKKTIEDITNYEGYIEAGTEMVTSVNLDNNSFITGKIYNFGGNTENYTGGAISVLSKETCIKLLAGGVYDVKCPFITNAVACVLYDENLTQKTAYAVRNENALNISGVLNFEVDLSNELSDCYLAVSTSYNPNTQFLNKNISAKNKYFFKQEKQIQFSVPVLKNDLKTNINSINQIAEVIGVYGSDIAEYKIKNIPVNSRISVEFNYRDNLTNVSTLTKTPFLRVLENNQEVSVFGNISAPCTQQKASYVTDNISYIDVPKYNFGYYKDDENYILNNINNEPLVGDNLFLIWLKGSRPNAMPTEAEIITRSSYIESMQDYCIDISSDNFKITRDGIAVNDTVFNNGETSTVFSTSLKESGNWKTLKQLYEELLTAKATVLADFYFEFFDLSYGLTCKNIIQAGKIKLVGNYNQQVNPLNNAVSYNFDSYPYLIKNAVDYKTHVLDIISKSSDGFDVYVDGVFINSTIEGNEILLGGSSKVVFKNLEFYSSNYGDAEIKNSKIISDRTPYIVGLMGHGVNDNYEKGTPNAAVSLTRLADVSKLCYEKGYKLYNASDISNWAVGNKKLHKKAAFYMFDDSEVSNGYVDNIRIRSSYSQYGHPINFAAIANVYYQQPEYFNKLLFTRLNGNGIVNHSFKHDVPMARKNSVVLNYELKYVQEIGMDMFFEPSMFVYNWSGSYIPTYDVLKINGYNCAVNSGSDFSTLLTNKYDIRRMDISENTTIEYIKTVLF